MTAVATAPQSKTDACEDQCRRSAKDCDGLIEGLCLLLALGGGGIKITQLNVKLKIQLEAAGVPIGRADERPVLVDYQKFGMVEGRRRVPNPAAVFEYLPKLCRARPAHQRQIGPPRQDDIHLHAT